MFIVVGEIRVEEVGIDVTGGGGIGGAGMEVEVVEVEGIGGIGVEVGVDKGIKVAILDLGGKLWHLVGRRGFF